MLETVTFFLSERSKSKGVEVFERRSDIALSPVSSKQRLPTHSRPLFYSFQILVSASESDPIK
jgi:hypothetical protein